MVGDVMGEWWSTGHSAITLRELKENPLNSFDIPKHLRQFQKFSSSGVNMFHRASRRFVALTFRPVELRRSFLTESCSQQPQLPTSTRSTRIRPTKVPINYAASSMQIRTAMFSQRLRRTYRAAGKDIWRKNPVFFPFAVVSIIAASAFCTYLLHAVYVQTTEVNEKVTRFPDSVAKELRKALYFTEVNLEPQKALVHYKAALRIADEIGMHPYSDEVMGIKLQIVDMLVKAGFHKRAAQMLSRISTDAIAWINKTRHRLSLKLEGPQKTMPDPNLQEILSPSEEDVEYESRQATRTLKKVIGLQLLLGDLHEDEHLKEPGNAFMARRNALDLLRQEILNRQDRGLPPVATPEEEDDWLSAEEAGNTMSDLGENWLRAGRPDKALELLMPAIAILREVEGKQITCRQVVLLTNVAAAMFDHKPNEQSGTDNEKPVVTVEKQMEASRDWALKAIEVSKKVQDDLRDDDCDLGCAAAADVLSAIAEWQGADEEARKWLREEKRYCESASYAEGIDKVVKLMAEKDRAQPARKSSK
ncbi:hypothetical protein UA08_00442 [Talaromyces atroroseus]|uniref:Uncharacterized protein n=1 Tax=Talaromyces atroroseus TaxID=1441469 RepID=A0A225B402_TALAT|nr:hypothetical protein UA08_00442 [Talaromyces atroroseus]OKL64458.1 hypothetical protein UA08_00442 [Talaromyces atroroseus]